MAMAAKDIALPVISEHLFIGNWMGAERPQPLYIPTLCEPQ